MIVKYLKVWTSFREIIQPLKDDEKGRLFDMMLLYAETGEMPTEFVGNESFLFPVAKQQIDLAEERCEKLRQNASKGGLAKSKNKQELANDSKSYQELAEDSKSYQELAVKKSNVIESNVKESNETKTFIVDADARLIQSEHDRLLDAAEDAGFNMTNDVRATLIALYADHGLQKLLDGFRACTEHGVANIAYLRGVLKGEPKKKATAASVNAQKYDQRDYQSVQDDFIRQQNERIAARLRQEGATA